MATIERSMRRFYRAATAQQVAGGFGVQLDRSSARTPGGAALVVPQRALAEAIAREWETQEERIRVETMPLTRLVATAIDRVALNAGAVVAAVSAYAETDLLCYRAEAPADLADRQEAAWRPLLDWAADRCGARLVVTAGIAPVAQPAAALQRLRGEVEALDPFTLTAIASAVQLTGSLVVGLALVAGRISAAEAFACAALDETYQADRWGLDDEAEQRRRAIADDLVACARLAALVRGEPDPERLKAS